jgi:hypothetical protein
MVKFGAGDPAVYRQGARLDGVGAERVALKVVVGPLTRPGKPSRTPLSEWTDVGLAAFAAGRGTGTAPTSLVVQLTVGNRRKVFVWVHEYRQAKAEPGAAWYRTPAR